MPRTTAPHVDAEAVIRQAIIDITGLTPKQVGEFPTGPVTGDYVAVEKMPGSTSSELEQVAEIDIDVFAGTRSRAKILAFAIEDGLLQYPRSVQLDGGHTLIDEVLVARSTVKVPWDEATVRRQGATYVLSIRR